MTIIILNIAKYNSQMRLKKLLVLTKSHCLTQNHFHYENIKLVTKHFYKHKIT